MVGPQLLLGDVPHRPTAADRVRYPGEVPVQLERVSAGGVGALIADGHASSPVLARVVQADERFSVLQPDREALEDTESIETVCVQLEEGGRRVGAHDEID